MWRKPVIRALVTDAVAVSVSYCQVPAATAGIWTPLFSLIMGVSALLPRGGEKLVTAESMVTAEASTAPPAEGGKSGDFQKRRLSVALDVQEDSEMANKLKDIELNKPS